MIHDKLGDDNYAKASLASELKEKLRSSLASYEMTRRTIQSINETQGALEEKDLSSLFSTLNLSRNDEVFVEVPHNNHRAFANQLQKLCTIRRTLNDYKSMMDTLGNFNWDYIIKFMKEEFEREEATYQQLVAEYEQLRLDSGN